MVISMLKIRRPLGRLIFNMGIAIPGKTVFLIETAPRIYLYLSNILQWHHNGRDVVSNHQHHDCLFNRLFRHRSKKTSKLRVTGLCEGNSPLPVNSAHKWPVTRKMFPFNDVIRRVQMIILLSMIMADKELGIQSGNYLIVPCNIWMEL